MRHFWNGRWDRVARRDVFLWSADDVWWVEVRRGGPAGRRRIRGFPAETEALSWIFDRIIGFEEGWREPRYLIDVAH